MKKFIVIIGMLFYISCLAVIENRAATITVTNNADGGAGSLRQAITNANPGDTIDFAANVRGAILLTSELIINKNLIINGPGANLLGVEGRDQPTESRVFYLTTATAMISSLRISNGFSSGAGGGVIVSSGSLTLNNCLINGNGAESGGGAFVSTGGTLTITSSTISGNSSAVEGGGVSNRGGTLFLINTTIIGNTAPRGGGVSVESGNATILNSTISGNRTGNSTTSNVGGLRVIFNPPQTTNVILKNSIVANNSASFAPIADFGVSIENVGGIINSHGNNLIGITTGGHGFIASDLLNVNPLLGVLANHGGGTFTVSLLPGSPAINAGNNTGAPATDQRGVARPQGGTVDIGAYESGVNPALFGKIVFSRLGTDYEIFSMNADGSNQLNLTNNPNYDTKPKWSPDGSKIVFVSNRDGNDEIYTMNSDGSNQTRLTNNAVADDNPAWSPGGGQIAFDRSGQIFVMNADGTNVRQLTSASLPGAKAHPSWSPDGTRIVYHRNGGFANFGLYIVNSACNNCASGSRIDGGLPSDNFDPVWSPDGNTIAFSNDRTDFNDHSDPYTFLLDDINDSNLSPRPLVTPVNPRMHSPAWSPDGTKLVHYRNTADLYIINADGSNSTNLGVTGRFPDWGGFNTPTGTNVSALSGTTSITFAGVSIPGTTTVVPIDATTAGNIPGGYSLGAGFPAFEITTTATFTAPITVCLQVPSVTNAAIFNALTLFHNEGGVLIDRTVSRNFATKTICANVSSLSPFVVAENLAPSAANVSISGRVADANGNAVSSARISITNQNGETGSVATGSFGFYRFDEIPAGQTYVISAFHKRWQFNSQVIFVSEDIQNADFTAQP